jgi:hypothetical protein
MLICNVENPVIGYPDLNDFNTSEVQTIAVRFYLVAIEVAMVLGCDIKRVLPLNTNICPYIWGRDTERGMRNSGNVRRIYRYSIFVLCCFVPGLPIGIS